MDKRTGNKPKSQAKPQPQAQAQNQSQDQSQKSSVEFAKEICPKEKNNNKKR